MAEIDLQPTEEMASNAARGLELREKHGRGGTAVGVARARDIKNRKNLSPETVKRMHSYFARHEVDKKGEGWGTDSAGYIAWLLWGGDSGQSWAKRKVEQMDKSENQRSDTYKEIAQRLGSAATNDRPGAKARMGQMRDTKGRGPFRLHYIASGLYGEPTWILVDKAGKAVAKEHNQESADAMLRKANAGEPVYVSSRPGAKARFGSDTNAVNRQARMWLAQANRSGASEGLEQFHARLTARLAQIIRDTDAMMKNPELEQDYGGWSFDDLEQELLRIAPYSGPARRWMQANLRGGRFSRPGAKARMAESLQAMWDGKQWKLITPSGAAWYSDDGKRWTKKHGEPVSLSELRQYAIKLGTGFSRPGAKVANAVREGEKVSASDDAVSRKIRKLMDEGKPQKQAVAIALDLERRGEL